MRQRGSWGVFSAKGEPPAAALALAEAMEGHGAHVLAIYTEPVGERWQLFSLLPLEQVEPTPYQRDLSKPHVKRLQEVIKKLDRFIDPIVVVTQAPGKYWTPNGYHRLAALQKLKAKWVPAILIPEPKVAFQILALNTEKAHNIREKSLEVIRMYRALQAQEGDRAEEAFGFQFEEPYYITLGLLYERHPRFAGGAFSPILRRVDRFLRTPLSKSYEERQGRAEQVEAVDALLGGVVVRIKKRGINHPYIKNFILARCNPLTRARKSVPSFEETFDKLYRALERFDVDKVRMEEIARAAVMSAT
ncbi:MAG: ParB/RepB/Spo0J family partition protein [candidate division NC10 bacterium]|nr:ParB/RepB/Spo0J family partition protein [candidate division NC10 bacterium]MCH7895468.1 ParB/RepB/Spo0J family partition protein [candidate division NC10 bacterium]MCZ6550843.1 ParB/RepB/Spo0J family partition protein [candidate division NC10 bacterium]